MSWMRRMFLWEILLARTNSCLKRFNASDFADGSVAHDFDGYGAVEVFVVGLINASHAALAEKRFDAITRTEIAPRSDDGGIHHLNCFGIPQRHRSPAA